MKLEDYKKAEDIVWDLQNLENKLSSLETSRQISVKVVWGSGVGSCHTFDDEDEIKIKNLTKKILKLKIDDLKKELSSI